MGVYKCRVLENGCPCPLQFDVRLREVSVSRGSTVVILT